MQQGAIRLFKFAGIQVYLHWSWFLIAIWQISRDDSYHSPIWPLYEYLALFGIVLLHEFGHSLACKSVGGAANHILLWPFGGVASVQPPRRAGAVLWSIAAGPLVNVVLIPIFFAINFVWNASSYSADAPDFTQFLEMLGTINLWLLIFNMLPIYPLDGGQILRAVLWFFIGENQSLLVATFLGLIGGVGLAIAVWSWGTFMLVLCAYLLMNCWQAFQFAREQQKLQKMPPGLES